jgi:hypothetical protein
LGWCYNSHYCPGIYYYFSLARVDAMTIFKPFNADDIARAAEEGREAERQRIIAKLDKYTMYRFEKQWVIDLIEENDDDTA